MYDNAKSDKIITAKIMNVNLTRAFYICLQEYLSGYTDKDEYLIRRLEQLKKERENSSDSKTNNINKLDNVSIPTPSIVNQEEGTTDWSNLQGDDGHVVGDLDLL